MFLLNPAEPKKEPGSVGGNSKHLPGFRRERETGFEPATLSLGSKREIVQREPDRTKSLQSLSSVHSDQSSPYQGFRSFPGSFATPALRKPALRAFVGGLGRALTVQEVADRLGVSTATVYKLCISGALPSFRVSTSIRIRVADLDAYVARGSR
jgi:excisionase family DNA binding protein